MYNRYIQSDRGSYVPISDDPLLQSHPTEARSHSTGDEPRKESDKPSKLGGASLESLKELWNTLSARLHLDTGDLLLLAMLYFLYREDADEELLIALGLLLFL